MSVAPAAVVVFHWMIQFAVVVQRRGAVAAAQEYNWFHSLTAEAVAFLTKCASTTSI